MSTQHMSPAEREYRRMARIHGRRALTAIELARPSNGAGDSWIRWAHAHAVDAAHDANRALRARDRREGRTRRLSTAAVSLFAKEAKEQE